MAERNFKESFKFYKARFPAPDLSEVVDVDNASEEVILYTFIYPSKGSCSFFILDMFPIQGTNIRIKSISANSKTAG